MGGPEGVRPTEPRLEGVERRIALRNKALPLAIEKLERLITTSPLLLDDKSQSMLAVARRQLSQARQDAHAGNFGSAEMGVAQAVGITQGLGILSENYNSLLTDCEKEVSRREQNS